jgi:hypothetical protein
MSVLTQPAPTAAPEFGEEPPSGGSGNRRTLLLVGGLVAALAAAAAAYFFLFSGGGDPAAPPSPAQPKAAAPSSAPSAAPSASASKPPTSSYQVTKRDPFAPLPSAGSGSTTTNTTSSSSSSTKTSGAPKPAAPIAAPITLILASVDAKAGSATLSVDGTSYSTAIGKVFGKNYMLYAVFNATCAGVLVGDQSVPLCIGHSVSVTP